MTDRNRKKAYTSGQMYLIYRAEVNDKINSNRLTTKLTTPLVGGVVSMVLVSAENSGAHSLRNARACNNGTHRLSMRKGY